MIAPQGVRDVVSVGELARSLQRALDRGFQSVWVAGELSNVRVAASGHVYFVLKDDEAQLTGVAFRSVATRIRFRLEDGLEVVVGGRVGLYVVRGALQLYADQIEPIGAGALALAYEQLKARLEAEGLFATARKRALPLFPSGIGVVTSARGAAIRDVRRVLADRWPAAHVVVQATVVQGVEAAPAVARAIAAIGRRPGIDVVIVARGGGSLEDLWAFNTEVVARALAVCPVPSVSGIGHESDVTIADLVADVRGSTPTAAAALATPDRREMGALVDARAERLAAALRRRVGQDRLRLVALRRGLVSPRRRLQEASVRVDERAGRLRAALARRVLWDRRMVVEQQRWLHAALRRGVAGESRARVQGLAGRLRHAMRERRGRARGRLAELAGKLDVLSPLASLARGYAIVRDPTTGAIQRDAARLRIGDALELLLARGRAYVRVEGRED